VPSRDDQPHGAELHPGAMESLPPNSAGVTRRTLTKHYCLHRRRHHQHQPVTGRYQHHHRWQYRHLRFVL